MGKRLKLLLNRIIMLYTIKTTPFLKKMGAINKPIKKYLLQFREIEGWLNLKFIPILSLINQFQIDRHIEGGVAEIGIHHGKLFIPLFIFCDENEFSLAIDCFEKQEFNYDNSGKGDYKIFINNLKKFSGGKKLVNLKIIKEDSTKLNAETYLRKVENNKFRIFSIDGCHTAEATKIDLKNSYGCLTEGGVIIIDDYFNHHWPGVSQGVNAFFNEYKSDLKPFFVGFNKILFTNKKYADKYIKFISEKIPPTRTSSLFGSQVVIYGPNDFLIE
ncbi:MAG: class I SAM-dependent methyltransferase [Candidatus Aenigmarchaeota archaeon]|nr:class I SAM-dependent methyltransferase [Candidatus Aenigmarchaeota archaeon]